MLCTHLFPARPDVVAREEVAEELLASFKVLHRDADAGVNDKGQFNGLLAAHCSRSTVLYTASVRLGRGGGGGGGGLWGEGEGGGMGAVCVCVCVCVCV